MLVLIVFMRFLCARSRLQVEVALLPPSRAGRLFLLQPVTQVSTVLTRSESACPGLVHDPAGNLSVFLR